MLRNSTGAWGSIAKSLHWALAALILFLTGYGWWMTHLAERAGRLALYGFHSSLGYDVLFLLALRLVWRAIDPAPLVPRNTLDWERAAANVSHVLLYVLMLAVCISGWLMLGAATRPIDATLFGFITVPTLTTPNRPLHDFLEDIHRILSYALLGLIVVHVAAALRHHFIKRNDVLRRMWWGA
jgi:cytochrome b561